MEYPVTTHYEFREVYDDDNGTWDLILPRSLEPRYGTINKHFDSEDDANEWLKSLHPIHRKEFHYWVIVEVVETVVTDLNPSNN